MSETRMHNMGKKNTNTMEAPTPVVQSIEKQIEENKDEPRYVVIREGHRVSDQDYSTPNDPVALEEMKFWKKVATDHSWGEPVEIVLYDNKLHRVW